jgi:hypothetical protein
MYSLDLPMQSLFLIADLLGLFAAYNNRIELVGQVAKAIGDQGDISPEENQELAELKAKSRRLARTYKGLKQVLDEFSKGPEGLEAKGLDRVRQGQEEMLRLKIEVTQVITDFDMIIMKAAGISN